MSVPSVSGCARFPVWSPFNGTSPPGSAVHLVSCRPVTLVHVVQLLQCLSRSDGKANMRWCQHQCDCHGDERAENIGFTCPSTPQPSPVAAARADVVGRSPGRRFLGPPSSFLQTTLKRHVLPMFTFVQTENFKITQQHNFRFACP